MNRKAIIGIIIAVAIIGVGAAAMMLGGDDTSNSSTGTNSSTSKNDQQASITQDTKTEASLTSLATGGKAQKCTFSYSGSDGQGSGTMYTAGDGRGRMQIAVKTDKGNEGESNMLVLSDKSYTWTKTDEGTFGFMLNTSDVKSSGSSSASTSNGSAGAQNYSMDCESWNVDTALLAVPSDVNFISLPSVTQ
jgi:uncharacterized protein YxeA